MTSVSLEEYLRTSSQSESQHMTIDEIDDVLLKGYEEALLLNASKSSEFVINNRQQSLNIRTYWPSSEPGSLAKAEPTAFILYLHGFTLHSNRPTEQFVGRTLAGLGIGFVTMDFHGHGHSEGKKALINHADDVIDDVLCVLLALFSERSHAAGHNLLHTTRGVPFFLMGHSMGGAAALLVSNLLTTDTDCKVVTPFATERMAELIRFAAPCFRGALLLSPMVKLPSYVKAVVSSLGSLLNKIPRTRDDEAVCRSNWVSPKFAIYVLTDRYPAFPHGLTYWGGARVITMKSLCALSKYVKQSMVQFSFAFIVFHDTQDSFVRVSGSHMLMERAPSHDKTIEDVARGLHDPLTNRVDYVCKLCVEWVLSHT